VQRLCIRCKQSYLAVKSKKTSKASKSRYYIDCDSVYGDLWVSCSHGVRLESDTRIPITVPQLIALDCLYGIWEVDSSILVFNKWAVTQPCTCGSYLRDMCILVRGDS
jgi:hypothetical protein